ncbi:MAG TPA: hypothetical protein VGK79_05180 [Gaiellaceae bacterium]
MIQRAVAAAALIGALAVAIPAAQGAPILGAQPDVQGMGGGYLGFCAKGSQQWEWNCYLSHLRTVVLKQRDPARYLPGLDNLARASGGFLEGNCHMLMHVVGRAYARVHHVTLENLQQYLPLSNDPGCSAGFGMGLVMALSPQITSGGAKGANAICAKAPTRMRNYTCYHSLGHAYMRFFHGGLKYSLDACRALGRQALDCEQGSFHDYWLARSGEDGAEFSKSAPATARKLCAPRQGLVAVACWYRYYLSLPPKHAPSTPARILALCDGLGGFQREGCIAAASLVSTTDPNKQFSICARLPVGDIDNCMRGVGTQNLTDAIFAGRKLIVRCAHVAAAARLGCFQWFGTALQVLSDGQFARLGCRTLKSGSRASCLAGAKRAGDPLVTFA